MASPNPFDLMLRKLETHAQLDEEDREALRRLPFRARTLDPSTYLVREGEPPEYCAVLISGFAFRHKLTGDGTRQIVALQIPGDALDLQHIFFDVADHNVQTLTRAEIAFIPRAELQELARTRPAIGHALFVATLVEASIFREWVLNVGRRDARTRVAHLLCEFAVRMKAQRLDTEYGFELPMTQEQLADTVGLTPVHVNRTLKLLEIDGLIERTRRQVRFPNWESLRDVGDFSERYLHLHQQGAGASAIRL